MTAVPVASLGHDSGKTSEGWLAATYPRYDQAAPPTDT